MLTEKWEQWDENESKRGRKMCMPELRMEWIEMLE